MPGGTPEKAPVERVEAEKAEVKRRREPLNISATLSKQEKAAKIKENIQAAREAQRKAADKRSKLDPKDRRFELEKREIAALEAQAEATFASVLKNILGLNILPPDVQRDIEDSRRAFERSKDNTAKPNFTAQENKGKRLENEGKNPANPDLIKEVAGMVLAEEAGRLNKAVAKYATPEYDVDLVQTERENESFSTLKDELDELKSSDEQNSPEAAGIRKAMYSQMKKEEKPGGYLEKEAQKAKEWEAKIVAAGTDRDKIYAAVHEIGSDVQNTCRAAREDDQFREDAMNPKAGMKSYYLGEKLSEIYRHIPKDSEIDRIQNDLNFLGRQLVDASNNPQLSGADRTSQMEALMNQMRGSREALRAREQQMAMMMGGSRGGMYGEPLPEDPDKWHKWVWERIQGIDTANISPSMLVYFPDWASLLTSMDELTKYKPDLAEQVQAWRAVYELNLLMDASGNSQDMMGAAPNMDVDAIVGLLGSKTKEGKMIRKAFAKFEENGETFIKSTAGGRKEIRKQIAKELNDFAGQNPRDFGEEYQFGITYERIAFRYWKLFGREAAFDKVVYYDKGPRKKEIVKDSETGLEREQWTNYREVSDSTDKLVRDRAKIRESGKYPTDEKYGGYLGESKFWLRRLLNFSHGVRQENNLEFIPELFDQADLRVRDFFTDKLLSNGAKEISKYEKPYDLNDKKPYNDGRNFLAGRSIKKITEEMLAPVGSAEDTAGIGADYENIAWKYAVWMDAVNKSSKTRDALIATGGVFEKPVITLDDLKALRSIWDNVPEKDETVLVKMAKGFLDLHKDRGMLRKLIPIVTPQYGPDGKAQFPNVTWRSSRAGMISGIESGSLDRDLIDAAIDNMIRAGFVSPHAGEMLKRQYLGIDLPLIKKHTKKVTDPETGKVTEEEYPLIPGIGPVRFIASMGQFPAKGLFGFLFSFLLGFAGGAVKHLTSDLEKSVGK